MTAPLDLEKQALAQGYTRIVGVDEVGRGSWAGPLVVGVVILPLHRPDLFEVLKGVRDSKQVGAKSREKFSDLIKEVAPEWAFGVVGQEEIDLIGISSANEVAIYRAIQLLPKKPDFVLLDGNMTCPFLVEEKIAHSSTVRGDSASLSIAAASIIAKVCRDEWMTNAEDMYPGYGFAKNKGYGTALHRAGLKKLGLCPLHRRSFRPMSDMVEAQPIPQSLGVTGD